MFVGTVSSRRVMRLFWMTTTSGLAVVVVIEVGMVVGGFSEALRPGRSAYRVVPYRRWCLRGAVSDGPGWSHGVMCSALD